MLLLFFVLWLLLGDINESRHCWNSIGFATSSTRQYFTGSYKKIKALNATVVYFPDKPWCSWSLPSHCLLSGTTKLLVPKVSSPIRNKDMSKTLLDGTSSIKTTVDCIMSVTKGSKTSLGLEKAMMDCLRCNICNGFIKPPVIVND